MISEQFLMFEKNNTLTLTSMNPKRTELYIDKNPEKIHELKSIEWPIGSDTTTMIK